jgi:hypothetical protein
MLQAEKEKLECAQREQLAQQAAANELTMGTKVAQAVQEQQVRCHTDLLKVVLSQRSSHSGPLHFAADIWAVPAWVVGVPPCFPCASIRAAGGGDTSCCVVPSILVAKAYRS